MKSYLRFALFTLCFCVAVILWGAYVRASGSGAGCGAHWPQCNGELFRRPERIQELIEYSHRLSSGLSLVFVLSLAFWTFRLFPRGSFQRKAAAWSGLAIVMEALIGAVLVLARLVEHDKSIDRVFSISLHLVNTLLLLGALTVTYLSARSVSPRWRWADKSEARWAYGLLAGFALLGAMGAMAALGDTLFPSTSLSAGFAADFDGRRHFLERIRIFHPLVAV
ncbi:MAG: COX15/CtaA family protein, partial [Bdellovibrionota bacterium]